MLGLVLNKIMEKFKIILPAFLLGLPIGFFIAVNIIMLDRANYRLSFLIYILPVIVSFLLLFLRKLINKTRPDFIYGEDKKIQIVSGILFGLMPAVVNELLNLFFGPKVKVDIELGGLFFLFLILTYLVFFPIVWHYLGFKKRVVNISFFTLPVAFLLLILLGRIINPS